MIGRFHVRMVVNSGEGVKNENAGQPDMDNEGLNIPPPRVYHDSQLDGL